MPGNRKIMAVIVLMLTAAFFIHRSMSLQNGVEIVIVHFNDLGGRIAAEKSGKGGLIRLAAAWNDARSKYPDALFLVSGDMIMGSALSSLTRGEGVMRLANRLDIDAFVPGNHEFDYGVEHYLKLKDISEFPFIAANMSFEDKRDACLLVDATHVMLEAKGLKVGVVGAITSSTPWLTFLENTKGVRFDTPNYALRDLVPMVDRDAQLVVALTHIGTNRDRKLAMRVPGIDIIVGGHTPDPTFKPIKVGKTWITNAGANGKYLGIMRVALDPVSEKVLSVREDMIVIDRSVDDDPGMKKAAAIEESRLGLNLDEKLCGCEKFMDRNEDIGPWIATLLKKRAGADLGMVNVGGVRADFYPGAITYRDVFRVMPFDNRLAVINVKGATLAGWLKKGNLITDRHVKPVRDATYRVATMDFIVSLHRIPPGEARIEDIMVRDIMIEDLKTRESLP